MEQKRAYVTKIEAAAPAEIQIARVAKWAVRTLAVWKTYRDATHTSEPMRVTRDAEGRAKAQAMPRSYAVQTPGALESLEELYRIADWYQQQAKKYWTASMLDEIETSIVQAGWIALQLGIMQEGPQVSSTTTHVKEEPGKEPGMAEKYKQQQQQR